MPWRVWVGGLGRKRLHCTLLSIGSRHGLHAHLKHDKLVVLSTRYLFVGHKRPASLDWCDFSKFSLTLKQGHFKETSILSAQTRSVNCHAPVSEFNRL